MLQERLSAVETDFKATEHAILSCLQLARNPQKLYESATDAEKRSMLGTITSNRSAVGKNVEIAIAEPFSFLPSAKETASCTPIGGEAPTVSTLSTRLFEWAISK